MEHAEAIALVKGHIEHELLLRTYFPHIPAAISLVAI
jgi:hypothetical protein